MKNLIGFLFATFVCVFFAYDSFAVTNVNMPSEEDATKWWGTSKGGEYEPSDFMIDGTVGWSNRSRGTFENEDAIVAMIATEITEHGGYFCPVQLQCTNSTSLNLRSKDDYFRPFGFNERKCAWLCEPGYSGKGCVKADNAGAGNCDVMPQNTGTGGRFSGTQINTASNSKHMDKISAIHSGWDEGDRNHSVTHLGIIQYMDHGVIAAPVRIVCQTDGWWGLQSEPSTWPKWKISDNNWYTMHSYIGFAKKTGNAKLLCAEGFVANADGTDCVLSVQGCNKIYDINSGNYVTPNKLSQSDLAYGKGKTKNTASGKVSEQCWTKLDPTEYKKCVLKNANRHVPMIVAPATTVPTTISESMPHQSK